jgi:hypothetical protein
MPSTKRISPPVLPTDHTAYLAEAEAALDALVATCSALTGQAVDLSTLIRALAVYAQRHGEAWLRTEVLPLIQADRGPQDTEP